jgi:two-component system, OmpR family, response regulator
MRKILVVDDDQKTRTLLKAYLEKNNYQVLTAQDGAAFLSEFQRFGDQISLVVLDIMLPDTDGFTLCQAVRRQSDVPIIMLTANSDETDRIVGLELGADDYIAKPYSPRELLARIKAIHRRYHADTKGAEPPRYYRFGGFALDIVARTLTTPEGEAVRLSGLDFQLLRYFVEHPGEVLDRSQLSEETRGRDSGPLDRYLDVQVSRLRQRLNDNGRLPDLIKTVRGAGYVFAAEVQTSNEP